MDRTKNFSTFANDIFTVLSDQGYFDFEADPSPNEQCVNLVMHKNYFRYDVWLKTDTSTIWSETVQLAFLVALENLRDVDITKEKYSLQEALEAFQLSGFTNIKTLNPSEALTIIGVFEGHRIFCKITFKDISNQITLLRKHALSEAQRTGIYKGIDPRYTVKKPTPVEADSWLKQDIDSMDGHEFEHFCAKLLERNGYRNVSVTKSSGDQGIDILAKMDDKKYGIQCKRYASPVGNKAVMETYAGVSYYGCDVGVVLTNQYFTPAAKDMATRTGVILWDREYLLQLISKQFVDSIT